MLQNEFTQFLGISGEDASEIFAQFPMLKDTTLSEAKAVLSVFCEFDISIFDAKTLGYSMPQILLLSPTYIRDRLTEISRENNIKGEQLLQMIFHTPNILIDYETTRTNIYIA